MGQKGEGEPYKMPMPPPQHILYDSLARILTTTIPLEHIFRFPFGAVLPAVRSGS